MKIISCHIEHFGKWTDKTFSFEDGCNVVCEENGWGKSMLAAFIRAMFYGFDNGRVRDEYVNERKRYQPWQGGVCGGRITFEAGGKIYELTRLFGTKEKDDRFELRDAATNLKSGDYSANIGEELFGIDRASFGRTVFIAQNDREPEATDAVNAKIGNLSGEKADLRGFEAVSQRLTELLNQMSPTRKTGELNQRKAKIAALKDRVSYGPATDRDIEAVQGQKKRLETEWQEQKKARADLQRQQQELIARKEWLSKKEQYGELCREYAQREDDHIRCRRRFPGELPDGEELERYIRECTDLIAEKKTAEMFEMTAEDLAQLEQDSVQFAPGRPSDEAFAEKREQADTYRQLQWEMQSARLSEKEKNQLSACAQKLGADIPDREELRAVEEAWRKRAADMGALMTKTDYLHRMTAQAKNRVQEETQRKLAAKKARQRNGVICLVLGLAALAAGVILVLGNQAAGEVLTGAIALFAAALVLSALGVSGLVRTAAVKIEEEPVPEEEESANLRREIEADEQRIAEVEERTQAYLERWNREYQEDAVLFELSDLSAWAELYAELRKKEQDFVESGLEERVGELQRELESFLGVYYPDVRVNADNCDEWLNRLEKERDRFNDLRERKRRYNEAEKKFRAHQARINTYISALSFRVQDDQLRQLQSIQDDWKLYKTRTEELEKARRKKETFEAAVDMEWLNRTPDPEAQESGEELAAKLNQTDEEMETLQKQIRQQEKLLEELREKRDAITADEEALQLEQEEYTALGKHYRLLNRTKELLEKAKTSFTARYTEPVASGFRKYYRMLTGKEAAGCYLDADLRLTVSEQGLQREARFFSEGWRDLLGICMRMALVDAMYRQEKPVVIFDDPFVNLDAEKTAAALEFLAEISREYQVIYFTCHESRT